MSDWPTKSLFALSHLSGVDAEEVTGALLDDLEGLEPEDIWERAGATCDGYVDTGEAADKIIQELLTPYLEEMDKYQKTGLSWDAWQMCKGLLLGFYEFEYKSKTEFKNWATDAPLAFAEETLITWIEKNPSVENRRKMRAFIEKETPRWSGTLLASFR